ERQLHFGELVWLLSAEFALFLGIVFQVVEFKLSERFVGQDFPIADAHGRFDRLWGDDAAPVQRPGALDRLSLKNGQEIATIEDTIRRQPRAGNFQGRDKNIGADDGLIAGYAGLDLRRPAHHPRNANSAFIDGALPASKTAGRAAAGR